MKKALIALVVPCVIGCASAQDLNCQTMFQQFDARIPVLCDHVESVSGLYFPDAKEIPPTWDDARGICERHFAYIMTDSSAEVPESRYTRGFGEMCHKVDLHFESEKQRAEDIIDQADIKALRQFLEMNK